MTIAPLNEAEIVERLAALAGWERRGGSIVKTFKTRAYLDGLALATAVGVIAEGFDHHPVMTIGWCEVTISLTTHSAGDKLTRKDFDVAAAIDALPYP